MSMDAINGRAYATKISRVQISIVTQLFRVGTTVHHVDELFQWLAYTIVDQFDIQLVQFWTSHVNQSGQLTVQLRTMVRQDPSLPEQVVVNDQVALVVQHIANERPPAKLMAVDNIFLNYQAALLRRYGLNYCISCFMSKNILIPAQNNNAFAPGGAPKPLAMTALFLLRQSPPLDLLPALNAVLEQVVTVAGNRGLLLPASPIANPISSPNILLQQETQPALLELIPRRKQDPALMMSSNPFASSAVIADKQARRLYAVVDGRTDIANLCAATHMGTQEVHAALQILITQKRIELYAPDGRSINPAIFFTVS